MQEPSGASLSAEPPAEDERRRRGVRTLTVAALVTFVADQVTKVWALGALDDGRVVPLVGDLLSLRLLRNSGAAFSLGGSMTWLMTLVALVVTVGIVVLARRVGSTAWGVTLGLVLGGSVGNLVDRFLREPGPGRGHVIDFIDYLGWFVGNVADIGIVGGAVGAVWLSLRDVPVDGSVPRPAADEPEARHG